MGWCRALNTTPPIFAKRDENGQVLVFYPVFSPGLYFLNLLNCNYKINRCVIWYELCIDTDDTLFDQGASPPWLFMQALRFSPPASEVILAPHDSPLTFPVPVDLQRDIPISLLSGWLEAGSAATPGFCLIRP